MNRVWKLGMLCSFAVLAGAAGAQPAGYPTRPVRVLVGLPPGGDIDTTARLTASYLERRYKQSFVVENKPGAGGSIGTLDMLKPPRDGYTLLVNAQNMGYLHLLVKDAGYSLQDIVPIAKIASSGYVLVTSNATPAKDWREFISHAKANPGKLNWAGAFSFPMAELLSLLKQEGVQIVHVPYKGAVGAYAAVASGEAQLFHGSPFQSLALAKEGRVRAIAYTGAQRHPSLPDVATIAETTNPGFSAGFFIGLFGPTGMPAEIAARLNADIAEMVKSAEVGPKLSGMGYVAETVSVSDFRRELQGVEKVHAAMFADLAKKQ